MGTICATQRQVKDLRPGDHALLPYSGPEEQRHVLGSFIRDGLTSGEKIIYFVEADRNNVPSVSGSVPDRFMSVVALDGGRRSRGHFDSDRVTRLVTESLDQARREGCHRIRLAADMTWALHRPNGLEMLMRCENLMESVVSPSVSMIAMCQYDRGRCTQDDLNRLQTAHPVAVVPDPEFQDSVLQITRTFQPPGLALRGELDAARHAVFSEALTKVLAGASGGSVHLDLADLGFIDLGALGMLTQAAARRSARGPLVLDRISPQLRGVMETVGWAMLPGLRLGTPGQP